MFIKFKFFRLISVFCLIFLTAGFIFADTIRLKDGSIIKGKIVSFDAGNFTVLIDDGARQRTLNFRADEVESILFDNNASPASNSGTLSKSPPVIKTEGNSTIITVGQKSQNTNNLPGTNSTNTTNPQTDSTQNSTIITAKPISISIAVMADNTSNGWTNSGWVVRKGQKIKIKGNGRVSLGNGRMTGPSGISSLPDNDKLIKNQPTGGLIAVIGADNNEFIFVGETYEFIAQRDGDLFLGVNEGNLNDNSGSFSVTIEIDPNTGN